MEKRGQFNRGREEQNKEKKLGCSIQYKKNTPGGVLKLMVNREVAAIWGITVPL